MSTVDAVLEMIGLRDKLTPEQAERKQKLAQLSFEQSYQSALANARAKQSELRNVQGAEAHANAIGKLITEAEAIGESDKADFKAAYEKLAPTDDLHLAGKKEASKRRKSAEAEFKQLFDAQRKLEADVAADKLLTDAAREEYRTRLASAVRPLLAKSPAGNAGPKAAEALNLIKSDFKAETSAASKNSDAAQHRITMAEQALKKLEGLAALREIAKFARQKSAAESLVAQRDFEGAIAMAGAARDDAVAAFEEITAEHDAWLTEAPSIDGAVAECKRQASLKCLPLETVAPTVAEIETELKALTPTAVGKDVTYADARVTLAKCLRNIEANKQRAEAFAAVAGKRDEANKVAERAIASTRQMILSTEGDLERKFEASGLNMRPQREAVDKLETQWRSTLAMALSEAEIDTAPLLAALKNVEKSAADATSTDGGRFAILEASKVSVARPAYEEAQAACREKLAALSVFGAATAKLLGVDQRPDTLEAKLLENIAASEANGIHAEEIERLTKALKELAASAAAGTDLAEKESAKRKLEAEKVLKSATNDLKELNEKIERYSKSVLTEDADYEKYVDVLNGELVSAEGMIDGTDLDLLDLAKKELTRLRERVKIASSALDSTDSKGNTLQAARLQARLCTKDLDDVELTKYLPESKAALQAELGEITGATLTTHVDETLAKLAAWRKKLGAAQREALAAREGHETFLKDHVAARAKLTESEAKFADAKEYYKSLLKQFDRLPAAAKSEGGLEQAKSDLEMLNKQVSEAIAKPESMKEGQAGAKKRADEAEENEVRWKALYEDYVKTVLPQVKAKKVSGTTYDELVEMGKNADKAFKRTKDLQSAKFQINHAKERARFAIEFPEGLELAGRNNLPKVQAKWKTAVTNFLKKLAELNKEVSGEDADAGKAVEKTTTEIGRLFNAAAFDTMIHALLRADATAEEKQAQREEALAVVRRYRRYVQNDYRFKELATNEFVKPFTGNFELNVALLDVEKNLLISL